MAIDRGGVATRSALASAEVTTTLVVAHATAGGTLPPAAWVAATAAAVFGAGLLVLRGSLRPLVALPALVAVQLGLHLWFVVLTPAAHPGHVHGVTGATGAAPDLHLGWPMLAAHLLGAAVTALAWHVRGRLVRTLIDLGGTVAGPVTPARRRPASTRTVRPAARLPLSLAPRRGPPVALAT